MSGNWELLDDISRRLEDAGIASPDADASILVDEMVARFGEDLDRCDRGVLDALVERRLRREPLQLVVGHTTFRYVRVPCRRGVFIPRPETEIVAGVAIDEARALGRPALVVEPCTGTGAIAMAVASEVPRANVIASDASRAAVMLARENVERLVARPLPTPWTPGDHLAPEARLAVAPGRDLDGLPDKLQGRVDVLVSNPPYLPASDRGTWEPEVADHDPDRALVGGDDGHEVVNRLLGLAMTWLRPGGLVVLEIDDRRGDDARAAASAAGLVDVEIMRDLTGRDRAVTGRRPATSTTTPPTPSTPVPEESP